MSEHLSIQVRFGEEELDDLINVLANIPFHGSMSQIPEMSRLCRLTAKIDEARRQLSAEAESRYQAECKRIVALAQTKEMDREDDPPTL